MEPVEKNEDKTIGTANDDQFFGMDGFENPLCKMCTRNFMQCWNLKLTISKLEQQLKKSHETIAELQEIVSKHVERLQLVEPLVKSVQDQNTDLKAKLTALAELYSSDTGRKFQLDDKFKYARAKFDLCSECQKRKGLQNKTSPPRKNKVNSPTESENKSKKGKKRNQESMDDKSEMFEHMTPSVSDNSSSQCNSDISLSPGVSSPQYQVLVAELEEIKAILTTFMEVHFSETGKKLVLDDKYRSSRKTSKILLKFLKQEDLQNDISVVKKCKLEDAVESEIRSKKRKRNKGNQNTKVEPKVEVKVEPKVEVKVEPNVEPKVNGFTSFCEGNTVKDDYLVLPVENYWEIFQTFKLFVPLSPILSPPLAECSEETVIQPNSSQYSTGFTAHSSNLPNAIVQAENSESLNQGAKTVQSHPFDTQKCEKILPSLSQSCTDTQKCEKIFPSLSQSCTDTLPLKLNETTADSSVSELPQSAYESHGFLHENTAKTDSCSNKPKTNSCSNEPKTNSPTISEKKILLSKLDLVPTHSSSIESDKTNIDAPKRNIVQSLNNSSLLANSFPSDAETNEHRSHIQNYLNTPLPKLQLPSASGTTDSRRLTKRTKSKKGKKKSTDDTHDIEKVANPPTLQVPKKPEKLKLQEALDILEFAKFEKTKVSTNTACRNLHNALLNPGNIQNATQAVILIVNHLKSNSQKVPLTAFVRAGGDTNVLLPFTEEHIVKALYEVSKKGRPHLRDLLTIFYHHIHHQVFDEPTVKFDTLMAFCRVLAAFVKFDPNLTLEKQMEVAWDLCIQLLTKHLKYFPFAAMSVLSIWAETWSTMSFDEFDPVQQLLLKFMLVKQNVASDVISYQRWEFCFKALRMIFKFYPNKFRAVSVLGTLISNIKSCRVERTDYYLEGLSLLMQCNISVDSTIQMANSIADILSVKESYPKVKIDKVLNFKDKMLFAFGYNKTEKKKMLIPQCLRDLNMLQMCV